MTEGVRCASRGLDGFGGAYRAAEAAVYNYRKPRKLREAWFGAETVSTATLDILMRGPYSELYLHFVWGTWRRHPFTTPELQRDLYASIAHHSTKLGADVIAIGGMPDHVHLLVRFPTTISVSEFMRRVKGGSSHLVTHVMQWPEPFKWQGGYGVF